MRKPVFRLPRIKNRRRAAGWAQNIIILVLVVSAVVLISGRAGFGSDSQGNRFQAPAQDGDGGRNYGAAAEPMCVMVTPEDGVHSAAMYDSRTLETYYTMYSSSLAEALGSAGEPEEVSDSQWRGALSGTGVYFDYYTDCQLSSLAIWLGADGMSSSASLHTARRLCLSLEDGEVVLYYMRERMETAYRCSTELSYTELAGRISGVSPNGAHFAFELEDIPDVDDCTVIVEGVIDVHTISGTNTLGSIRADELMDAFGINSNLAQGYYEADGTSVFLEGMVTLRLGTNGELRFTNRTEAEPDGAELAPSDAVELTRRLLERTVGLENGVAALRLSYISYERSTREYTLRYDYARDGLPVSLQGRECAAEFRLTGGAVTYADILFRSYSYTGGTERPLPAVLNAAAVQADGGGEPRLVYIDSYSAVSAKWITV